jgi:transposase
VLFWDGTGLCLFAKRLEKGHFAAPWSHVGTGPLSLTMNELELLLEGSALVWKVPLSPSPWAPEDRVLRWG